MPTVMHMPVAVTSIARYSFRSRTTLARRISARLDQLQENLVRFQPRLRDNASDHQALHSPQYVTIILATTFDSTHVNMTLQCIEDCFPPGSSSSLSTYLDRLFSFGGYAPFSWVSSIVCLSRDSGTRPQKQLVSTSRTILLGYVMLRLPIPNC